jgi:glycosyltransferase involved in cell wall biosynthesis
MGISRRIRILMLLENSGYPADDRVRREARTLINAGYSITLICPGFSGQRRYEQMDEVEVYRYPYPKEIGGVLGYLWEYGYSMVAISLLALYVFLREGFDIIHAHQPPDQLAFIAVLYRIFGKKYILDHHDLAPELYEARFRGAARPWIRQALIFFEKFACRRADRVIATNHSYKKIEMERDGVPEEKITIVRNGPDLRELFQSAPDPTLRKDAKTIIGYVGVTGTQDGADQLVRAVRHLIYDFKIRDFLCIIVGSGDALPGLKLLAKQLGISDHILFTGWINGQEKVRSYLNSMDICAAPEPSDPYNRSSTAAKVMEYMAVGKPVVSFDLPEHHYSAQGGALYARPNDELDFARQLASLIDQPDQRKRLGEAGLERIKNVLAWEHQADALQKMYATLFGSVVDKQ